jgi:hypothetical protein
MIRIMPKCLTRPSRCSSIVLFRIDQVGNLFHFLRTKLSALDYHAARAQAFSAWTEIAAARLAA